MFRSKTCDQSCKERYKQQTPGSMFAGHNHGSSASLLHSAQGLTYRRQFSALSISLMHEFGLVRIVFAFLQDPRSLIEGVACNQSENKPS
jgi:hypothetical protein